MQQEDFNTKNKKKEVEMVGDQKLPPEIEAIVKKVEQKSEKDPFSDYASIIEGLRKVKAFRTTAPTNVPKSFIDAIEFYDDGANRRVYFYINKTWRYATLT